MPSYWSPTSTRTYELTKMRRIPNFVLLRAFEAAARLQSFTLAAEELHLTQSAISHQVKGKPSIFDVWR